MGHSLLACALVVSTVVFAAGQACPKSSEAGPSVQSEVRTLEGQLLFHDDIRKWFELKLDDFSPTGYYSLNVYQDAQAIESVGRCERQPLFPDYSKAKPDKAIRAYRVDMHVNYEPGDHPIVVRVTSAGKELRPWQAYASYWLTGGFVLYGHCGDGFVVDRVFGTPEAHPGHFDDPRSSGDMATFDPESAAAAGKKDLQLGYTCVHNRRGCQIGRINAREAVVDFRGEST
jgi:hypothetical protein